MSDLFSNFHDPKVIHHVVITCMTAVEIFRAPTFHLRTLMMQSVSGTSDQDTQSLSCSSLLSSKCTRRPFVITNSYGVELSLASNSNICSSFAALRTVHIVVVIPFLSTMDPAPVAGFWGRCVAGTLSPSTPPVLTWPCVSGLTVAVATQDFRLSTKLCVRHISHNM